MSETEKQMSWSFFGAVAAVVLVLDQVTKFLAVRAFTTLMNGKAALGEQLSAWLHTKNLGMMAKPPSQIEPLVPGCWSWRYAENHGSAFSFAANWPDQIRVPFFHIVTLVALVLIGSYYRKLKPDQTILKVALSLVMGGALGNFVDRLVRGYVIDFIDWFVKDAHWPTFNVADTAISVGVGLIAVDSLLVWLQTRKQPAGAAGAAEKA